MRSGSKHRGPGLAVVMLNLMAIAACGQDVGGTATQPVPRPGNWMTMHESFLKRAEQGDVNLLFLGDSITQGWNNNPIWQRHYGPRHAANFGIGGDRTEHVLWRLNHGEVDSISPKVVVLMIGTNNIGHNTAQEIAAGVQAIVAKLQAKLPETKVLLLGIFPRGASRDKEQTVAEVDPRTGEVNAIIAKLDDGKNVKYLDIGKSFLDADGKIHKDVMPDFLHLSQKGYTAWADAIEPTLWNMLDEGK